MNEEQTSPQHTSAPQGAEETIQEQAVSSGQTEEASAQTSVQEPVAAGSELDEAQAKNAALTAERDELSRQVSDLKDQFLRSRAELENTRKRLQRDKEEAIQFANKQILVDVVSIIDDFERAIRSAEEAKDFQKFYDGISLIEKHFVSTLERKWGVQRFDAAGEEFDPQRHEAVAAEPRSELPPSTILEVYQKGYLLNDRVLRTAKVKVSMPA